MYIKIDIIGITKAKKESIPNVLFIFPVVIISNGAANQKGGKI